MRLRDGEMGLAFLGGVGIGTGLGMLFLGWISSGLLILFVVLVWLAAAREKL